jgi:hypothetical protein
MKSVQSGFSQAAPPLAHSWAQHLPPRLFACNSATPLNRVVVVAADLAWGGNGRGARVEQPAHTNAKEQRRSAKRQAPADQPIAVLADLERPGDRSRAIHGTAVLQPGTGPQPR